MVPDLSLGIFAVATSTCDLYGDGDALAFPVANQILPLVEALVLEADAKAQGLPNASFTAAISGQVRDSIDRFHRRKIVKRIYTTTELISATVVAQQSLRIRECLRCECAVLHRQCEPGDNSRCGDCHCAVIICLRQQRQQLPSVGGPPAENSRWGVPTYLPTYLL